MSYSSSCSERLLMSGWSDFWGSGCSVGFCSWVYGSGLSFSEAIPSLFSVSSSFSGFSCSKSVSTVIRKSRPPIIHSQSLKE